MEPVDGLHTAPVADLVAIGNDKIEFFCSWCHLSEVDLVLPYTSLVRCSRCQEALYCSTKCKKAHFRLHRALCKRITSARVECLAKGDIACLYPTEDERCGRNRSRSSKEQLADAIFLEGYQQGSHSVQHAARLYAKALEHYTDMRRLRDCSARLAANGSIVIKSTILLLALRCDDVASALLMDSLSIDRRQVLIPADGRPPGGSSLPLLLADHKEIFMQTSDTQNLKDPETENVVEAEIGGGVTEEFSQSSILLVLILFIKLRWVLTSCLQDDDGTVTQPLGNTAEVVVSVSPVALATSYRLRQQQKAQYRQIRSLLGYANVRYAALQLLREEPLNSLFLDSDDDGRGCIQDEFFLLLRDCFSSNPRMGELLRELLQSGAPQPSP